MAVTIDALRLQQQLDTQVQTITDAQTRLLTAAWVLAWAEVSADLQDTLVDLMTGTERVSRSTMLRSVRLRRMLAAIADRLDDLAAKAGVTITSDLGQVVKDAAARQADIVAAQFPGTVDSIGLVDVGRTPMPDGALDAIVRRTTKQITSGTKPLAPQAYDAVRRELIRGVAVGSNPREVARRMVRRSEKKFNGGLTRALVISRTEILSAHREAAEISQAQHADVLAGWIWLCHLSPRTCPSCLAKHGSFHELDEPGPYDHQQGRCSRMPKAKSWAELGFDVPEPDDLVQDAEAWFGALPEAEQVAIMGRARLDLLRSGAIEWADLTQLRSTAGWRDSWAVTPVKDLQRAGGRGSRRAS